MKVNEIPPVNILSLNLHVLVDDRFVFVLFLFLGNKYSVLNKVILFTIDMHFKIEVILENTVIFCSNQITFSDMPHISEPTKCSVNGDKLKI